MHNVSIKCELTSEDGIDASQWEKRKCGTVEEPSGYGGKFFYPLDSL